MEVINIKNKNNSNNNKNKTAASIQGLLVCQSPNYLRVENVEGYVLIAVYIFIYLFVCVLLA